MSRPPLRPTRHTVLVVAVGLAAAMIAGTGSARMEMPMTDLTRASTSALALMEKKLDRLRERIRQRRGHDDPVVVLPYRGFGTAERLWLMGRVLEDELPDDEGDGTFDNLIAMYRRYESDEVPGARVEVRVGDRREVVTSDEEGYFEVVLEGLPAEAVSSPWTPVSLSLLSPPNDEPASPTTGLVLVPPPDASFGVISDMDDTVVETGATSLGLHVRTVLLNNARTRRPFLGVGAFYRALVDGVDGKGQNPVFYVSSSPWNLYDLFVDFLELNGVPGGPILLKDFGIDRDKFIKSGHEEYKVDRIARILETYPDLPFILVGDSGQRDPWVYRLVLERFPGRILAIYIRDLTPAVSRPDLDAVVKRVGDQGVEMMLARDSLAAAVHAHENGWITRQAVAAVESEVEARK